MSPATLRQQYRAARTLAAADERRARLDQRVRVSAAVLAGALGDAASVNVPGYRVDRRPDGLHVTPLPPTDGRQLALWRAMNAEEAQQ